MSTHLADLKSLHTALVDSRHGYEEALDDAEGRGLTPLFAEMVGLRTRDAEEIAAYLRAAGEEPDEDGSFMSTVNRTVISLRSVITGLGSGILPSLISGEERILSYYDDALTSSAATDPERGKLLDQRAALAAKIDEMRAMETIAD